MSVQETVGLGMVPIVIENNVAEFVLSRAKVTDKVLPFDELMTAS